MTEKYSTIHIKTDGRGVATLTINRPEKHNALNDVVIAELSEAARQLGADASVRLVVLTAVGKSFCAGGDIDWFAGNINKSRKERIAQSASLEQMLHDLDSLAKPLIGRINGSAFGGGVGLISVCDQAIGLDASKFGLTEVRLGLIPANISPYVVRRIGGPNCRATMLSGALFSGQRAAEIGLLTDVVAEDELDFAVGLIINDHLEAAPGAVAETKKLIDYVLSHSMEENRVYTAVALADAWEAEEGQQGIITFLKKKLPPWRSDA